MSFLVVVFGLVVAEEVVALEPVTAGGCSTYTAQGKTVCESKWWCAYNSTPACIDDPCLKVQDNDTGCEGTSIQKSGVNCTYYPGATGNLNLAKHDCKNPTATGGYCASLGRTAANALDYCGYAEVRDGECVESLCKKDSAQDNKCFPNTGIKCQLLSKDDCKLVPKCMWNSSQCSQDPCFSGTDATGGTNENKVCSNWVPTTLYSGAEPFPIGFAAGDCSKEYKPYTNSGGLTTYCIYKDHSDDPNLCYYLGFYGNDTDSPDDYFRQTGSGSECTYKGTYPTYSVFGNCILNPECTATVAGCDGVQDCATKYNPTGAFAGQYCGDAKHGAAAASLRVPSLIAFLVLTLIAFFN